MMRYTLIGVAFVQGVVAALAESKAETDGKIHYDGEVLTFKAEDTVFKMGGAELSAGSFRTTLDTDRTDVDAEMVAVADATNDAIAQAAAEAAEELSQHSSTINSRLTQQRSKMDSTKDAMTQQIASSEADLIARLTALEASLTNKIAAAKQKLDNQLNNRVAKAASDVPKAFAAVQTALSASAAKFTTAQAAALVSAKSKAGKYKPQWIGGRTDWGYSNWQKFSLNRRDFEGNMGHFRLVNNEWQVLTQGVYKVNYWGIMLGSRGDGYGQVRVNGQAVFDSGRIPYKGGYWDGMHIDHTMKLKKGDKVSIYLNSNWRTSYPTSQGRASAYNRAWFGWEGEW